MTTTLFFDLSVCVQDNSKSYKRILMNFSEARYMQLDLGDNSNSFCGFWIIQDSLSSEDMA